MDSAVTKTTRKQKGQIGGGLAGPGRPKGGHNKVTVDLKDMILGALSDAGGRAYLAARAKDPRTASAFLTLVGKALPLTIRGAGENGEHVFELAVSVSHLNPEQLRALAAVELPDESKP